MKGTTAWKTYFVVHVSKKANNVDHGPAKPGENALLGQIGIVTGSELWLKYANDNVSIPSGFLMYPGYTG